MEWNFDADHNHSGLNISAIKFSEVKKQMEDDLPDLKQLANLDEDEIDEQVFTVSGYPDVTIANGGQEPIKHMMFSVSGGIEFKPGPVYGFDLLTSKGQNGGGLTNSEGELVGIYTGVGKHPASAEKSLGFATALTPDVKSWINEIE